MNVLSNIIKLSSTFLDFNTTTHVADNCLRWEFASETQHLEFLITFNNSVGYILLLMPTENPGHLKDHTIMYSTVDSLSYWPMFEESVWSNKMKSICQYQRWCWWSENYSSSWFCFVNFCQIHIKFQYLAHINVIPPSAVSGKCKNVLILILKLLMNWQDILRSLHWFEPWNLASHF